MRTRFLLSPNDSILNYYALPLIGLQKASFGEEFVRTYINKSGRLLYVEVSNEDNLNYISTNPNFSGMLRKKSKVFCVFTIPGIYHPDIDLILDGKYTKLSEQVKNLIKHNSGLHYKTRIKYDGFTKILTAKAIYALDDRYKETMIDFYQRKLGLSDTEVQECIIDSGIDLIDKLYPTDFIETYLN